MIDYIICIIFWSIFTISFFGFGKAITKDKDITFSHGLVLGYLVYSFLVALGGIPLQLLNVQWIYFAIYIVILWIFIWFYMIYSWKKLNLYNEFAWKVKKYIRNNWVLYMVGAVLILMMLCYYAGFWLGNHQDDGYYITKVATLPYGTIGGNYNYAVGMENQGFNSYIVNTWELEASVYVKLLRVQPTLYLRLFQSAFYYFLLLNLLKAFADKLFDTVSQKKNKSIAQYASVIVLLFGMYYLILSDNNIFPLRDMFHFNTGMFLGVSVVKMMTVLFFLLLFMYEKKITWKMVAEGGGIAIVLISKSTVALPIIAVLAIAALIVWLFLYYEKRGYIVAVILLFAYTLLGILLPNKDGIQTIVWNDMINALHSPVIDLCIVVFALSFFLKEHVINKINGIFLLAIAFMILPEVNDVFEFLSVYDFVAGRSLTCLLYFFVVLNVIYLMCILFSLNIKEKVIKTIYLLGGVALACVMFWGFKAYGGNVLQSDSKSETSIRFCLSVIKHNIYFMPNSTIELGGKINQLSQESDEQIRVIAPKMLVMDGALHTPAIMMRIYAPDIISLSAAERYPVNNGSVVEGFTQQKYDAFAAEPSEDTAEDFFEEIEELDVNCIVVQNAECSQWLEDRSYQLYDVTAAGSYYIWYR